MTDRGTRTCLPHYPQSLSALVPRHLLTAICLGSLCCAASAGDDTLTGNWGGGLTRLTEIGVAYSVTYTGEVFGNPAGGVRRGTVCDGLLEASLDFDLDKLAGWRGANFHAGALYPHGASGTERFVGDIGVFSKIDFSDSTRLYEVWLEQGFFGDRIAVRMGQLDVDKDFAGSDFEQLFASSNFGNSPAFSNNVPESTYAVLALGLRLKLKPFAGFRASFAAYDGNPATALGDPSPNAAASTDFNRHNTHWTLRGDEGALLAGELGYTFNPTDDPASKPVSAEKNGWSKAIAFPRPLSGTYKAGLIHHSDTFSKVSDVQLGNLGSSLARAHPRGTRGDTVVYFVADQEVWREPDSTGDGFGAFARVACGKADRNFLNLAAETGLVYRGLLQDDAGDQLGLGFAFLEISDRVADATRAANRRDETSFAVPNFEATIELTYQFKLTPSCAIQPDAQWILHPGGSHAIDDALVIGLRTTIAF